MGDSICDIISQPSGDKFKGFKDEFEYGQNCMIWKNRGQEQRVYKGDYFSATVRLTGQRAIEDRILKEFETRTAYNEWCLKSAADNIQLKGILSFWDDPEYRMVYHFDKGVLRCYCQRRAGTRELESVTDSTKKDFMADIVKYLRYKCSLRSLHYIGNDKKVEATLNMEITQRRRFLEEPPAMLSNSPDKYCMLYVPLDVSKPSPTWDTFLAQFNGADQMKIKCWMVSLFSEDAPADKFMLYIRGGGNTGKTTLCNALADIIGHGLYTALSHDRGDMARSGQVKDKLLISIPDNKNARILEDPLLFNITGKDLTSVRSLYRDPEVIEHKAKIIITSNIEPSFDLSKDYNMIRYVYCEAKFPLLPLVRARQALRDEFLGFIGRAYNDVIKVFANG